MNRVGNVYRGIQLVPGEREICNIISDWGVIRNWLVIGEADNEERK